jgi:predicted SprT family Zn-dependent metalloprotease
MIHQLARIRKSDTAFIFVCPKCKTRPEQAPGSQNKDQLPYVWLCKKCGGRVLAEWLTLEDRDNELSDFAKRVKILE